MDHHDRTAERDRRSRTIEALVRRARWIGAAAILVQFGLYSPPTGTLPWPRWPVLGAIAGFLAVVNIVSHRLCRDADAERVARLGRIETALDLLVGLVLVALVAFDPFSRIWPLLAVVIAEGAAREQLRGALATWGAAAAGLLAVDVVRISRLDLDWGFELPGTTHAMLVLFLIALILGALTRELSGARDRAADQASALRTLSGLSMRLSALRRTERVTEEVLRAATTLTGAPHAALLASSGRDLDVIATMPPGHAAREDRIDLVTRALTERRTVEHSDAVALPVRWPASRSAVLVVCDLPAPLAASQRDALALLAGSASVALDNAHRAEMEQATIQELRELDRMKDDFIGMLSHDLRSPLTSVQGYAQLLRQQWPSLPDETRIEFLEAIGRSSAKMQRLVEEILDAASTDQGALPVITVPTDLSYVLADPIATEVSPAPAHGLEIDLPDDARRVVADPERLGEVFQNLLSNAVKYSPDGGVVRVSSRRRGDWVDVTVSDDGLGLPVEGRDKMFHRFGRMHRDSGIPGTGIGLYIVRTLIEMMGGHVSADDAVSGGAAFTVTLPAAPVDDEDTPLPSAGDHVAPDPATAASRRQVPAG